MSEVLADAGAESEGIAYGRVHVRCALHVDKMFVDEIGSGLRESRHRAIASRFGGFGNFGQLGQERDVGAGSEPIEMFFIEVRADSVEFGQWHAAGLRRGGLVN